MIAPTATSQRKPRIAETFDQVAARYDRMCELNPGYERHLRLSAERLGLNADARVLDLCCGTGLSTGAVLAALPNARISAIDASKGMLDFARKKPTLAHIDFIHGDAMDVAAAEVSGPFDGILMAYGIRNVPDPDLCLARLREQLAPGGVLCLHEYSVRDSLRARMTWNAVSCGIVIPLALVVTGSTDIFRYLRRSVLEFDGVKQLQERLERAGFVDVETLPMDGWAKGILHTVRARRPEEG